MINWEMKFSPTQRANLYCVPCAQNSVMEMLIGLVLNSLYLFSVCGSLLI